MKTAFIGRLVVVSLIAMTFGLGCGSDKSKKSSSSNDENENVEAASAIAKPSLTEKKVEGNTLIIRYTHESENVTFQCKVKFNGTDSQWNSCPAVGEYRILLSQDGQYDIYIRAVKRNNQVSDALHVAHTVSNSGGGNNDDDNDDDSDDGDIENPNQNCDDDKGQHQFGDKGKGDCDPGQKNPDQKDPGQKIPDQKDPGQQHQGNPHQTDHADHDKDKDDHVQVGDKNDCYKKNPRTGEIRRCRRN